MCLLLLERIWRDIHGCDSFEKKTSEYKERLWMWENKKREILKVIEELITLILTEGGERYGLEREASNWELNKSDLFLCGKIV